MTLAPPGGHGTANQLAMFPPPTQTVKATGRYAVSWIAWGSPETELVAGGSVMSCSRSSPTPDLRSRASASSLCQCIDLCRSTSASSACPSPKQIKVPCQCVSRSPTRAPGHLHSSSSPVLISPIRVSLNPLNRAQVRTRVIGLHAGPAAAGAGAYSNPVGCLYALFVLLCTHMFHGLRHTAYATRPTPHGLHLFRAALRPHVFLTPLVHPRVLLFVSHAPLCVFAHGLLHGFFFTH